MKHLIPLMLAITLMLCCLPACGLAGTAESPIILGGTEDDVVNDVLPLANGNLILSVSRDVNYDGTIHYEDTIHRVWLLCLAPDGSVLWETTFGKEDPGGFSMMHYLELNDDDTFTGVVGYSIVQRSQYRQTLTFSVTDGTLITSENPVPDTIEADHILRNIYPVGGSVITEEIHDCEASCKPRTLRMTDAEGRDLWQLNANEIGISHIRNWIPVEQGALIYGRNVIDQPLADQAVAMLIDRDGNVLWTQTAEIENGSFHDAILDSTGRFIGVGFAKSDLQLDASGHFLGYGSQNQLIACWDAATGGVFWQSVTEMIDKKLPYDHVMEIDGQYILCGSGTNYTENAYETFDANGQMLSCWTTSYHDKPLIISDLFQWNQELWAVSFTGSGNSDVLLERVEIPEM